MRACVCVSVSYGARRLFAGRVCERTASGVRVRVRVCVYITKQHSAQRAERFAQLELVSSWSRRRSDVCVFGYARSRIPRVCVQRSRRYLLRRSSVSCACVRASVRVPRSGSRSGVQFSGELEFRECVRTEFGCAHAFATCCRRGQRDIIICVRVLTEHATDSHHCVARLGC